MVLLDFRPISLGGSEDGLRGERLRTLRGILEEDLDDLLLNVLPVTALVLVSTCSQLTSLNEPFFPPNELPILSLAPAPPSGLVVESWRCSRGKAAGRTRLRKWTSLLPPSLALGGGEL